MASSSRILVWIRRLVPAVLGAGLLYLAWRLVSANDAPVTVDFLVGAWELSVWEALLGAFGCGAALAILLGLYPMARARLLARRYRRRLRSLETEVHQLRNLPLSGEPEPGDARAGGAGGSGS